MPFEPAPLLIGLREGLEALLVLGIILGMLDRLGARDRRPLVWAGFAAGVLLSIGAGILIDHLFSSTFERGGAAVFEVVVALAAVLVLSYMVLWMQRNARAMAQGVQARVQRAVHRRQALALAFLGFITVVREGLEVVLFYGALSATIPWGDIALWGTVGFAVSAAIAAAIFRWTVRVPLERFFAVSGVLLILIAAGLLVHVVHAAAELEWIPHGAPLWDTSGTLPDEDHWLGGPLHALVGYEDQPTMLQLVLYVGYLSTVGGAYLAGLRPAAKGRRTQAATRVAVVAVLLGLALAAAVPTQDEADAERHGHAALYAAGTPDHLDLDALTRDAARALAAEGLHVGILVRSHGEPQHYNATTYQSFKQFVIDIWPYTSLPPELLEVDTGTYYIDEEHPFSSDVHIDAGLVDAWLADWDLPAAPVCDPAGLDAAYGLMGDGCYHHTPGAGPGLGEGDLFEILGLGAYRTWLKMENFSPKVVQTEDHFEWLADALARSFGDAVTVQFAYSVDPHTSPDRNIEAAVDRLVAADPDVILDAYMSSVHSDAMDTCMMRPHAEHLIREAGFGGPIVRAGMAGTHPAWGEAVAAYLADEADHFREGERVSVHLAQHGARPGSPNPCGPGEDQYHGNLEAQFKVARDVIEARFGDRFTVRHVYGQGADGPDDGTLSPMEALALDKEAGVDHVVVIPYEFWSDAMDALVPLRESLGFEPEDAPYYDGAYETHTTIDGIHIDVWSAHYGVPMKGTALVARLAEAIEALGQP